MTVLAPAGEWPSFRGPNGDGIASERPFTSAWRATGLKKVWSVPAETGFSSFTVADDMAFTVVRRNFSGTDREACVALTAQSGKELWVAPLSAAKYDGGGNSGGGGDGPRTTPVYSKGKVFIYDAQFLLTCVDAKTGKEIWHQDLLKDFGGKMFTWQNAAAPVVDGDLVLVAGGGEGQALLAFKQSSGEVAWKGQDDGATHATPVLAEIAGVRQAIFFTKQGLVAVLPKTGSVLWRYKFPFRTATAASPVVSGDLVYCSAGYGVGAGLVRITKKGDAFEATEVWRKHNALLNHWSTPVVKDGYLYGLFGHAQYNKAPLKCIELLSGEEKWSEAGFGPGGLILSGDRLLVLSDKGQLVLAEANPAAYREVSRMAALGGKCWSTPAVNGGRVFLRSTTEGVCLDAKSK